MAEYIQATPIKANGSYDVSVDPGKRYGFEVEYPSGVTATVAPSKLASDGVTYQALSWGVDPAADTAMSIAATGTAKGAVVRAMGNKLRFAVSSLSGGWIYIRVIEILHGR